MSDKIREAVRTFQEMAHFIEVGGAVWVVNKRRLEALKTSLEVFNSYLALPGFPGERVIDSKDWDSNIDFGEGYNQALRECRLATLKNMEGIEEVLKNSPLYKDAQAFWCNSKLGELEDNLKSTAQALRKYMEGR